MAKKTNRHGQHSEDLVGFSGYIDPELKAIAQVTANELNLTMMDLLRNGLISEAVRAGVMKDGVVVDRYRDIVDAYVDSYIARKESRKKGK